MTVQLYTAQLRAVPYRKTVNRAWCSRAMLHAILIGDSDWGPLCVERGLTSSGPLVLRALRRHHADMANLAVIYFIRAILIFRGVRGVRTRGPRLWCVDGQPSDMCDAGAMWACGVGCH